MKQNKVKNVTIPAATAELLRQMFVSTNGIDMSAIVQDLACDSNEALATINLGLLMQGKILQLPETTYRIRDERISVYKLVEHSVLKDIVVYDTHDYRLESSEEGISGWMASRYNPCRERCNIQEWFERETELPANIHLPKTTQG